MRTYFDHEKLDVYQLELRFITWVTTLLARIKQCPSDARIAEVSSQLDRANLSALLNTAEGNGRRQRRTRAKFFDDARGSATECAACLDALVAGICSRAEIDEGKKALAAHCFNAHEACEAFRIVLAIDYSGRASQGKIGGRGRGRQRDQGRE